MSLELLANELLLDLFEFLHAHHLIRAFHGLNTRFDRLLFIQLQKYHLDFRCISKHDFEFFCQQYLSSINDRIISLHLSDDVETPNLPRLFLSRGYRINQFIHLKSLSIDCISFDLLNQIISQCHELSYLTHLRILIRNNQDPDENFRDFINNIWSLSKLTHCYLDIQYPYAIWLLEMSKISQSIRYLCTKNICYNSYGLSHLLKHTPHLQRLRIGSISQFYDQQVPTIFPVLISLNLIAQSTVQWMKNLFQQIPNLCSLTLDITNIYLDGQQWEKILINYFPNLKIFRLKMTVEFSPLQDIEEQVDELIDSFRSDYWMEKHQWFVRCDWCPMNINETALLYTLPYTFDSFHYTDGSQSKSTSPINLSYSLFNPTKKLHHNQHKIDLCKHMIIYPVRFFNIRYLKIKLPFNDIFLSLLTTLNGLFSLDVTLNRDLGYYQLQVLLDRAMCLYSLRFCHLNNFSMESFNIKSTSIRRLEFFQNFEVRLRYFNSAECTVLANSSLAFPCEVLVIDVENRTDILQLINTMPNLRALSIRCQEDQNNRCESYELNDDLIEWLHKYLPSKYTYSINRNLYNIARINLWIYKA